MVFKEELTIGNREGDENTAFGQRVFFNVDQAGNIYIVDWDRKRIQKFDSTGRFLLTIGRQGQGPGEFRNVWRPEFEPDGSFYVVDIGSRRISFFSPEGKYLRQIAFPDVQVSSRLYFTIKRRYRHGRNEFADGRNGRIEVGYGDRLVRSAIPSFS